jgi:hypothetical protein
MQPARLPLQGDAVSAGVIDSKRSRDQTLNFKEWLCRFLQKSCFVLYRTVLATNCRCNWGSPDLRSKTKAREGQAVLFRHD